MRSELALLGGLLYVSLGCSFVFLFYCLRHREKRGATPLSVVFAGILLWIAADLIQFHTPGNPLPVIGLDLRLLGPDITLLGLLLFSLEYTGRERFINRRLLAVLSIKPLLTLGVFLSPLRSDLFVVTSEEAMAIGYDLTAIPVARGYALYNWMLALLAFALLVHMMLQADYGYRRQIVAVLAAFSVPFVLNLLFFGGFVPYDLTSASFLTTASAVMYATFRLRLMDALPVARRTVLEEMEDMVLVLDEQGTITAVNDAVRDQFGDDRTYEGATTAELFGTALADGGVEEGIFEVDIEAGDRTRHLEINTSPLEDYRENLLGQVLVCRDVTERERTARELRHREEELELLKDLQSRFLRHNLRNELNVVRLKASLLLDEDDPEQREQYQAILEKTDRVLEWGNKARAIEQLIEADERVACNLSREVRAIAGEIQESNPGASVETAVDDGLWVLAVPQVDRALKNVIDNAVRHNTAETPSVRITGRQTAEGVVVEVADNGPGVDHVEIETIRNQREETITHGSGLGLWLVYWVVKKSRGEVSFRTNDGTTVELRFDSTESREPGKPGPGPATGPTGDLRPDASDG